MSPSPEQTLTIVDDWHAAYNARDVDLLIRLSVPEIEIVPHQPLGAGLVGTCFRGHTGLKTLMRWTFHNYPRVEVHWEPPRVLPRWVISQSVYDLNGNGPTTRVFALFDIVEERIRRIYAYPDEASALGAALPAPMLTPREREIFQLLADGRTSQQIAAELFLSVHTVRTHVQNGIDRLGAKTRMHALSLALERGEIGSARQ